MSSLPMILILISGGIIVISLSQRAALSQNQIAKNRRDMLDPPKAYIVSAAMMLSELFLIAMSYWMAEMSADLASSGKENEADWELPMQLWRIGTACAIPVGIILGLALSRYQIALLGKHGPNAFEMAPHKILSASVPGKQGRNAKWAVLSVQNAPSVILILGLFFNAFALSTGDSVNPTDEKSIAALLGTVDVAYSTLALELLQLYLCALVLLPMTVCTFLSVRWYGAIGRARFGSAQTPRNTAQYTNADL